MTRFPSSFVRATLAVSGCDTTAEAGVTVTAASVSTSGQSRMLAGPATTSASGPFSLQSDGSAEAAVLVAFVPTAASGDAVATALATCC